MPATGFVQHPLYLQHVIDDYHPESPLRLQSIYQMVEDEFSGRLTQVEPREATHEEIGWVHGRDYIKLVESTEGDYLRLDPDTSACPFTYRASLLAAGGLLAAVDAVFDGRVNNAFAAIRPPGHHAEKNRAMGFCIFNNVAVAAEYAMRRHGCKRVLIFDWDLHHGNGTQHSFETTRAVLYMSTHQYPYYPGTGAFQEVGRGEGEGYTVNMPLATGYGSGDYLMLIERIIRPIALAYRPDLILISAGYDIYEGDPLGGMQVSPAGFGAMTHHMIDLADRCCGGKLVLTLEGGYHIKGLTKSVRGTLQVMLDGQADPAWLRQEPLNPIGINKVVANVINNHREYWPALLASA